MKMSKKRRSFYLTLLILLVVIAAIIVSVVYSFNHVRGFRDLFYASESGVLDSVDAGSEASLANRGELTAKISMWIFIGITALQFITLWVGYVVVSGIARSDDSAELKLKSLDNADIFFDVPLYVGLFGTVSSFLVMTFSPQSSRLIAYSSTLIGIIFSLVLTLALRYPLRRKLVKAADAQLRRSSK